MGSGDRAGGDAGLRNLKTNIEPAKEEVAVVAELGRAQFPPGAGVNPSPAYRGPCLEPVPGEFPLSSRMGRSSLGGGGVPRHWSILAGGRRGSSREQGTGRSQEEARQRQGQAFTEHP